MDLPDMPKKLKKREADITPKVLAYLSEHLKGNYLIEIKQGKNKLMKHQIVAREQVKNKSFKWKIPDSCLGKLPADAIILNDATHLAVYCKKDGRSGICKTESSDELVDIEFKI